jgi:uncharacterized protein YbjT (DUF2867 family)
MNILITGATGFVGYNVLKELLKLNHSISACIHKAELSVPCKVFKVDYRHMQQAQDWLPLLHNIDVVINCVGIISESSKARFNVLHASAPIALFKACQHSDVKKIIQVSALGADDSALVAYHKTKKQADDYLKQSNLNWFILKPSLVYGEQGESYRLFKRLSNLPLIPLVGKGQQLIQPVHIDVLVQTILHCLHSNTKTNQSLNVVGPKAISYQTWMQSLRTKKSKARFLAIPFKLMLFFAKLGSFFGLKLLSPDNLTMLKQNNIADITPLQNFLEGEKK